MASGDRYLVVAVAHAVFCDGSFGVAVFVDEPWVFDGGEGVLEHCRARLDGSGAVGVLADYGLVLHEGGGGALKRVSSVGRRSFVLTQRPKRANVAKVGRGRGI